MTNTKKAELQIVELFEELSDDELETLVGGTGKVSSTAQGLA